MGVTCGPGQSRETYESPEEHVPSRGLARWSSATCLFQLSRKQVSFFVPHVLHLLCFFLVTLLFKMALTHRAEVLSHVPSTRRLWRVLQRMYVCSISFLQAWVVALLAVHLVFPLQRGILNNTASFNKSTHQTRLYIDQVMEMLRPETRRNRTLYFP